MPGGSLDGNGRSCETRGLLQFECSLENCRRGPGRSLGSRAGSSYYYYDFKIPAKHFGPSRRVNYVFGDVNWIPPQPALVKSRPISDDNSNSVLFKLNRLRHFDVHVREDMRRFRDKKPSAVWRGTLKNMKRRMLVSRFGAHPSYDIGHTSNRDDDPGRKPTLTIDEQLAYRYIISVEGNDVASNLKWIMNSNSLCFMPQPKFETWFMEGALQPGVHFVELKDDFEDIGDKIAYYNDNIIEAEEIVANANAHFRAFSTGIMRSCANLPCFTSIFGRRGSCNVKKQQEIDQAVKITLGSGLINRTRRV